MSEQKVVPATEPRPLLPRQPEVNIGTSGHVDHGKCLVLDEYVPIGGVIGKPGTLPPTWEHITLDLDLLELTLSEPALVGKIASPCSVTRDCS